ncbi:7351_t:CDS:1, partial [Paraglomus occultum]
LGNRSYQLALMRLHEISGSLIKVKFEMLRLVEELKDAAWESGEDNEEIDLRRETKLTP